MSEPASRGAGFPWGMAAVVLAFLLRLKGLAGWGFEQDELYTPVGYGLNKSGPHTALGGDIRFQATVKLVTVKGTFGIPAGTSVKFSSNNGQPHQGGTCFGDSGGPIFRQGTLEIVAVTSFGISSTCSGSSGGYRIDQEDDLDFIGGFLAD